MSSETKVSLTLEDIDPEMAQAVLALVNGEEKEDEEEAPTRSRRKAAPKAAAKKSTSKGKAKAKDEDEEDWEEDDDDKDEEDEEDEEDWEDEEEEDEEEDEEELTADDVNAMDFAELKALAKTNKVKIKEGSRSAGYKRAIIAALGLDD